MECSMVTNNSPSINLIDGGSLFDGLEAIRLRYDREKITLDYGKLLRVLAAERSNRGWRPATSSTVMVSTDPSSEGQGRFHTMLARSGFEVDAVHFRHAFASLPAGRSPGDGSVRAWVSFSARLAYVAGLMAREVEPHVLFVSHSFELYGPLLDLAERVKARGGRVGLAFFTSLLDFRWESNGLLLGKLPIEFLDLGPHEEDVLGVTLGGWSAREVPQARGGLSKF
jgi:hypothetical protein